MAKQKTSAYESLIAELKTTKLTKGTLKKYITKCSKVIDDLGCEIMRQYETTLEWTTELLTLKRQQQHLIDLRDILFTTYNNVQSLGPTNKINKNAMEGVTTYRVGDTPDTIGSWSC